MPNVMKTSIVTITVFLTILLSVTFGEITKNSSNANNKTPLTLNGHYTYKFLGIYKFLEMDLYLPESYDFDQFLNEQPLSLKVTYSRSFTSKQLVKQGNKAIAVEGSAEENKQYAESLKQISAAYQDVKKGDSYQLEFYPETGLTLIFNGEKIISITEPGFAQYYFKIWLGDRDECQSIKQALVPQLNS